MRLTSGTRLGPYEVLDPLGAGGMGEVYRARDSRLGRDVAIKVLPVEFAATPELRQRFEREARAVSGLNHPNICTLHDIGHQDGIDYLVMELCDGETLAARIERGALPVDQALKIAIEVAEALDKAHRSGVVHRDLKPANIMLTKSGAKLLDFGLARLTQPDGSALLAEDGKPLAPSMTKSGEIVGTAGYLAPEQVRGEKADARSDIFALGAILFEMLTGRRAFKGDSAVATLYAIMNEEPPPLSSLVRVPAALERVVRTCLAKDPDERWQSARDLARELRWIAQGSPALEASDGADPRALARRKRYMWISLVITALIAGLAAFGAGKLLRLGDPAQSHPRIVSSIVPPEHAIFSLRLGPMALSQDGRRLAFVAADSAGRMLLWFRALDEIEARPLEGTDDASCPFWSPDGKSLGFFSGEKLERIDIVGGSPQVLAEALSGAGGSGGTWSRGGVILFSARRIPRLLRVPASGGQAEQVFQGARAGRAESQSWPAMLADDRHFLFTGGKTFDTKPGIYVGSLDARENPVLLVPNAVNASVPAPGRVMFWREGSLWAQSFNEHGFRTTGEARRVASGVAIDPDMACGLFAVSRTGLLAYQSGGTTQLSQLVWMDRKGDSIGSVTPPGVFFSPRLSHDGRRVAMDRSDPVAGQGDIWVFDVARRIGDRITSNPLNETAPLWSPDDSRLYWLSSVGAKLGNIHTMPSNGDGSEETFVASDSMVVPNDISPDGRSMILMTSNVGRMADLAVLAMENHKVSQWRSTPFIERAGRLSHDGHWIAYVSNESGEFEVYVQPFPQGGDKWRVSTSGGGTPMWRDDGREIFYVSRGRDMMSASFRAAPTVEIGVPVRLFSADFRQSGLVAEFGVSVDGQRLLINRMLPPKIAGTMTLEMGWEAGR